MYLLMLAAALLMQGADVHGRWELQNPAIGPKAGGHRMQFPDRVEFTLRSDDGGNSETSFVR